MRKVVLVGLVLSASGMYAYAQQRTIDTKFFQVTVDQAVSVSLSLEADSVQRLIDVHDIGVIKEGGDTTPTTLSGNVVIVVNGMRITANSAVYHPASHLIELNGGAVRMELPGPITSLRIGNRR